MGEKAARMKNSASGLINDLRCFELSAQSVKKKWPSEKLSNWDHFYCQPVTVCLHLAARLALSLTVVRRLSRRRRVDSADSLEWSLVSVRLDERERETALCARSRLFAAQQDDRLRHLGHKV